MTEEPYTFVIESFDMSELDPSEYYLKIFAWDSLQNLTELIRQPIIFDDSGRVQ